MKRITVHKDSYYDSVFLMLATRGVKSLPGISNAVVAMATPMNLDLLGDMGFAAAEMAGLSANDLVVAIDAVDEPSAEAAVAEALAALTSRKTAGNQTTGLTHTASLAAAIKLDAAARIAMVSVPGNYAAREARKALQAGLHVLLFSDNVSLDDEVALKRLAVSKGLLMMGPDCGTAIINGKPLCFANVVQRGPIGIVAASGTGLQEVSCLIDHYGSGVSQAIGTGGRDLKNTAVGGMTSLLAIEALAADPATKVLVVISKPPAPDIAIKVVEALRHSGKPAVAHFLGLPPGPDEERLAYASDMEEAALLAVLFAEDSTTGAVSTTEARSRILGGDENDRFNRPDRQALLQLANTEARALKPAQRYLRGLYCGGTLTDEALFMAHRELGGVWSNNQTDPAWLLVDPTRSKEHTIIDLGDDVFTAGKPHPMIDPAARAERIAIDGHDPETAVLLLDCVLGYGSHPDPAGACLEAIRAAKTAAKARGACLPVIASVTGTDADPQNRAAQMAKLEEAGVQVMPSNYRAALLAIEIARIAAQGGRQ
jgi:succinyl-CoA synthetase alpha subunit